MRFSSSLQSLHNWREASHTLTREGVSFPIRARFSMDARRARAEGRLEGEVWTRAAAWVSLVFVSSARSILFSSWPPSALPDGILMDGGGGWGKFIY